MDWVGPATTAAVALLTGIYLDHRARSRGSIEAKDLRRILVAGGLLLVAVAVVAAKLTA
jgi:hypothetical protein